MFKKLYEYFFGKKEETTVEAPYKVEPPQPQIVSSDEMPAPEIDLEKVVDTEGSIANENWPFPQTRPVEGNIEQAKPVRKRAPRKPATKKTTTRKKRTLVKREESK